MLVATTWSNVDKRLVGELILNWNDGNNDILTNEPTPQELESFLFSAQECWIR